MTKLRILLLATTALTATQLATSASHAQTAPLVVAQARDEGGPPGAKKEAPPPAGAPKGPAAPPAAAPPRPAAPPPPPPAAAPPPRPAPPPPPPAAAPPPRPTPPPPPPAAAPPPRPTPPPPPPAAAPKAADSAAAAPGGCTFAPDAAAASSTGSRARGAEATGRTDYTTSAATAAAFNSEVDAITRAATATRRRQTAAGACHHAGSDSTADGCPSTWRKHDDGATAASRRTDNASECGRPGNCTDHTARATRRAAACRTKRWRRPRRSGRDATGRSHHSWRRSPHGTDRRAGLAEFSTTSRPGPKRPADRRAGLPSGAASHRTVASGPAAGRRWHQSHSRGCADQPDRSASTTSAASAARASRAAAPSSPSPAGSSFAIPADSNMFVTAKWTASAMVRVTSRPRSSGVTPAPS